MSENCVAEPVIQKEYKWINKQFDSSGFREYDFSALSQKTLAKIKSDFKKTPYIVKVDTLDIKNTFNEISIERAWVSDEENMVYLLFSILWVSDIYVVYELKNFKIDSKYTTSGWTLK